MSTASSEGYDIKNSLIARFVFQIIYNIKKGNISDETGPLTVQQVCERIFQEVDVNRDGMLTGYSKSTKSSKTFFFFFQYYQEIIPSKLICLCCRSDYTGWIHPRGSEEYMAARLPATWCQSKWMGPEVLVRQETHGHQRFLTGV